MKRTGLQLDLPAFQPAYVFKIVWCAGSSHSKYYSHLILQKVSRDYSDLDESVELKIFVSTVKAKVSFSKSNLAAV